MFSVFTSPICRFLSTLPFALVRAESISGELKLNPGRKQGSNRTERWQVIPHFRAPDSRAPGLYGTSLPPLLRSDLMNRLLQLTLGTGWLRLLDSELLDQGVGTMLNYYLFSTYYYTPSIALNTLILTTALCFKFYHYHL